MPWLYGSYFNEVVYLLVYVTVHAANDTIEHEIVLLATLKIYDFDINFVPGLNFVNSSKLSY